MTRPSSLVVVALAFACSPELAEPGAALDRPRVIAVTAEPAEVRPGAEVSLEAVLGGPDGPIDDAAIDWAFCESAPGVTENTRVAAACDDEPGVAIAGHAPSVGVTLPAEACARFGPDAPPGGGRPVPPDPSGGYYQPVRLRVFGETYFHMQRITCPPPDVSSDVSRAWAEAQQPNVAPGIDTASAETSGAGLALSASFAADALESYVSIEPETRRLVTLAETLRVTWWISSGTLEAPGYDGTARQASASWQPAVERAWAWIVLVDSRGGTAVRLVETAPADRKSSGSSP